jgi:hypothetical protein
LVFERAASKMIDTCMRVLPGGVSGRLYANRRICRDELLIYLGQR